MVYDQFTTPQISNEQSVFFSFQASVKDQAEDHAENYHHFATKQKDMVWKQKVEPFKAILRRNEAPW